MVYFILFLLLLKEVGSARLGEIDIILIFFMS